MYAYSTYTGTQWDVLALPTMLEIPVISGGGSCVGNTSKEILKIAVDPLNASGKDINLATMLRDPAFDSNLRSGSIMYRDGEMVKITDDVVWFHFGGNYSETWNVFLNNRNFDDDPNEFAWLAANWGDTQNIPDYVIEGDYCAPANVGDLVEDTTEIIGYDYYIWENGAYRKVYSTTSYAHHQLVVVSELPAEGAVNVLYKVAYYQSMTDWTDNVDYGG